jgi:hypothetical protein
MLIPNNARLRKRLRVCYAWGRNHDAVLTAGRLCGAQNPVQGP